MNDFVHKDVILATLDIKEAVFSKYLTQLKKVGFNIIKKDRKYRIKSYSNQIHAEMVKLERATDELFDYSKVNLPFTDINLKQLIEYLLNSYGDEFESKGIKLEMDIEDNLILNCNEIIFYDIVQNLTNNAIKAMKDSETKIYRCTIWAHNEKLVMDFSSRVQRHSAVPPLPWIAPCHK